MTSFRIQNLLVASLLLLSSSIVISAGSRSYKISGDTLLVSSNGGITWRIDPNAPPNVHLLAVAPSGRGMTVVANNEGISVESSGGNSWMRVLTFGPSMTARKLDRSSQNAHHLRFLGVETLQGGRNIFVVYRSYDGGIRWSILYRGSDGVEAERRYAE